MTDDMDYWKGCCESSEFYTAHLHSEDDSCLATPDGRFVYHAGY